MAVFDGPLLQRASTIVSKDITSSIMVQASIAPQLPKGYTSRNDWANPLPEVLTRPFADILQDYSRRASITTGFEGCVAKCETVVQGAGFSVDCQSPTTTPFYIRPLNDSSTYDRPLFSVHLLWSPGRDGFYNDNVASISINSSTPEQLLLAIGYSTGNEFVTKKLYSYRGRCRVSGFTAEQHCFTEQSHRQPPCRLYG